MILLLAGTKEAREIAETCGAQGIEITASLAGATRAPVPLAVNTRVGGFGGDEGFRAWLRVHRPTAVLDATHPFAAQISARSYKVCLAETIPYLQLDRPQWRPKPGDIWYDVSCEQAVASVVAPGSTLFIATGRQTLHRFAALDGCRLICRQIDPPGQPFPFANGEYLISRPPFSVAEERALFEQLGIDWLVVKNAGGEASASKLVAARELGIPVAMIARPLATGAPICSTVSEALAWIVLHR